MKVRFKSKVTRGFSFSPLRVSCSPLRDSLAAPTNTMKNKKNLWHQGTLPTVKLPFLEKVSLLKLFPFFQHTPPLPPPPGKNKPSTNSILRDVAQGGGGGGSWGRYSFYRIFTSQTCKRIGDVLRKTVLDVVSFFEFWRHSNA